MHRYKGWFDETSACTMKSLLKTMDKLNKDREGTFDSDELDDMKDCCIALKDLAKAHYYMGLHEHEMAKRAAHAVHPQHLPPVA